MDFDDTESPVASFEVLDMEFASYMTAERNKVEELGKEIHRQKDKLSALMAKSNYINSSLWMTFFEKYPEQHPSNLEKDSDMVKYDPETSTVHYLKRRVVAQ